MERENPAEPNNPADQKPTLCYPKKHKGIKNTTTIFLARLKRDDIASGEQRFNLKCNIRKDTAMNDVEQTEIAEEIKPVPKRDLNPIFAEIDVAVRAILKTHGIARIQWSGGTFRKLGPEGWEFINRRYSPSFPILKEPILSILVVD